MTTTITIPAPCDLINANSRLHWAKKARLTKQWREAAGWAAKAARVAPMDSAHIVATIRFQHHRKRDVGNFAPTIKACVDGIVADARLLPGDDDAHIVGPDLRADPNIGDVRVVIELRPLATDHTHGGAA